MGKRGKTAMQRTQPMPRQRLSHMPARQMPSGRQSMSRHRSRSVPHRRRFPWIIAFCVMGLLALASHTSQLSVSALAGQGMQLATRSFYGAARFAARVPDTISLLAGPHAQHQYWQVGVMADASSTHASGMRAHITTRLPQRVADMTTNYFWIGSYLSDGSFIQIGYWIPWYDSARAGWFYCAFDNGRHKGPCIYGAMGTAGIDGASHTYALEAGADHASAADGGGATTWRAMMDGRSLGEFRWTAGETGTNAPAIYAELSGFTPHASISQLGPVDFVGGIETRHRGQFSYQRAAHMTAAYSAANVCPPYGIAVDRRGGVLLGSGLACPDRYSEL